MNLGVGEGLKTGLTDLPPTLPKMTFFRRPQGEATIVTQGSPTIQPPVPPAAAAPQAAGPNAAAGGPQAARVPPVVPLHPAPGTAPAVAAVRGPAPAVPGPALPGAGAPRPVAPVPAPVPAPNPVVPGPGAPKPAAPAPAPSAKVRATGSPFKLRLRHFGLMGSFVAAVLVPTVISAFYLFAIADDQYTSSVGFAVRSETNASALGLLAGLSSLSGSSSSDTDILYHYLRSQELVAKVDARLDLRKIYSKPAFDPVYTVNTSGTIEDLTSYWGRMVRVFYDKGTGLIELRVHAFDPQDAKAIADAIYEESSDMVNSLSAIARADATRYAREELDQARERVSTARVALTEFRSLNQIVDPQTSLQGQIGLLNQLQQQQAQAMIELSLLRETARDGDPRISEAERRITVIETMIAEEKRKFGVGGEAATDGQDYSTMVGEFERLTVEREFAERAYIAALTAFDSANAEAQRKSRYLAAYIGPTLAQEALYPKRLQQTGVVFAFALLLWSIGALIYYSVRDRR